MSTDDSGVQDNVIYVPFKLINEICTVHKHGGDIAVLAAATGGEPWVIEAIIRFKQRKEAKYLPLTPTPKEPA